MVKLFGQRMLLLQGVQRQLNANLAYATICGGQPMDKLVLYTFQTSLLPIYQHQRDERLSWPERKTQPGRLNRMHDASSNYATAGSSEEVAIPNGR